MSVGTDALKLRSRTKLQVLSPLDDMVLTAVKRGAWAVCGVISYIRIEHEIGMFPGKIRHVLAKLQKRGLVENQKGRWTVVKPVAKAVAVVNNGGSSKGPRVVKKVKQLSKKEARDLGEFGAFAIHLGNLLNERELTAQTFSEKCKAAKLDIKEHAVRAWLRGETMARSHQLRALGKVLGLADPRHILPG